MVNDMVDSLFFTFFNWKSALNGKDEILKKYKIFFTIISATRSDVHCNAYTISTLSIFAFDEMRIFLPKIIYSSFMCSQQDRLHLNKCLKRELHRNKFIIAMQKLLSSIPYLTGDGMDVGDTKHSNKLHEIRR